MSRSVDECIAVSLDAPAFTTVERCEFVAEGGGIVLTANGSDSPACEMIACTFEECR